MIQDQRRSGILLFLQSGDPFALGYGVKPVRRQVSRAVTGATRPADLHAVHARGGAEPEVDPADAGGGIAGAGADPRRLARTAGGGGPASRPASPAPLLAQPRQP